VARYVNQLVAAADGVEFHSAFLAVELQPAFLVGYWLVVLEAGLRWRGFSFSKLLYCWADSPAQLVTVQQEVGWEFQLIGLHSAQLLMSAFGSTAVVLPLGKAVLLAEH